MIPSNTDVLLVFVLKGLKSVLSSHTAWFTTAATKDATQFSPQNHRGEAAIALDQCL